MIAALEDLKTRVKRDEVRIDHEVFQLHYKVTSVLLLGFAVVATTQQFVGDRIVCTADGRVPANVLNAYCLMHAFVVPGATRGGPGEDAVAPGVSTPTAADGRGFRYQTYYQWVCLLLLLQSSMFCVPRRAWQAWEGGRAAQLAGSVGRERARQAIVARVTGSWHRQDSYAYKYFLCELFNLVNVVVQMFFVDAYLGGAFWSYVPSVLFAPDSAGGEVSPADAVFPKMTKCHFPKYGRSGTLQTVDGLCLLPLNNVYDKIFFVAWLWFVFLAVVTFISLLYRLLVISPDFRQNQLRTLGYRAAKDDIAVVAGDCRVGDWFVLYQLGKNIDPLLYKDILSDVAKHLRSKR